MLKVLQGSVHESWEINQKLEIVRFNQLNRNRHFVCGIRYAIYASETCLRAKLYEKYPGALTSRVDHIFSQYTLFNASSLRQMALFCYSTYKATQRRLINVDREIVSVILRYRCQIQSSYLHIFLYLLIVLKQ